MWVKPVPRRSCMEMWRSNMDDLRGTLTPREGRSEMRERALKELPREPVEELPRERRRLEPSWKMEAPPMPPPPPTPPPPPMPPGDMPPGRPPPPLPKLLPVGNPIVLAPPKLEELPSSGPWNCEEPAEPPPARRGVANWKPVRAVSVRKRDQSKPLVREVRVLGGPGWWERSKWRPEGFGSGRSARSAGETSVAGVPLGCAVTGAGSAGRLWAWRAKGAKRTKRVMSAAVWPAERCFVTKRSPRSERRGRRKVAVVELPGCSLG
jgi:hypothetical protein